MSRRRSNIQKGAASSLPPSIPSLDLSCLQLNESIESPPHINREGNKHQQKTLIHKNDRNELRVQDIQDRGYEYRDSSKRRPPRDLKPIGMDHRKLKTDFRKEIDEIVERHQKPSNKLPSLSRSDGARLQQPDANSRYALERRSEPDRRLMELPVASRGKLQPLQSSFRNQPSRAASTRLW